MAEDDKAMKSLRLPTFDGEPKNFQIWWMQFCACGTVYRFVQSIQQDADPDLPAAENAVIGTNDT
eukprot:6876013-Ditylum_brightwellii.AAC.1